ncbi:toxin HicA [Corynebacterium mastitidis]|uniref:Toxin HicA n=1 Tax=Corynebacterium mastitidis TaxID=161890 RepID=A0ABU8NXS5_9CORY
MMEEMRSSPANVRFSDLEKVCSYFFGEPRSRRGSHQVYRMPWPGDPRVNIQNDHGKAKKYQVEQVLRAVEKLQKEEG